MLARRSCSIFKIQDLYISFFDRSKALFIILVQINLLKTRLALQELLAKAKYQLLLSAGWLRMPIFLFLDVFVTFQ